MAGPLLRPLWPGGCGQALGSGGKGLASVCRPLLPGRPAPASPAETGRVRAAPALGGCSNCWGRAQILNQGISWKLQDSKPDRLMEFEGYLEEKGPLGTA